MDRPLTAFEVPLPGLTVLEADEWTARQARHEARVGRWTAPHRERRRRGQAHPVLDFLFTYYSQTPSRLERWHPGPGVALAPSSGGPAPHAARRWYTTGPDGVVALDVPAYLADRGETVGFVRELLAATASRPAFTGCFGLHEWAMVYRDRKTRHPLPLRLGREDTDAVVEAHPIRCSHFDAFRFFTPAAVGRNRLQPTRATQPDLEQPGCLHATMDLYKWAYKLSPAVPGELVADCFELAAEVRGLDMRASPYDLAAHGYQPVAIETAEGRAEYVTAQRAFAQRGAVLRARLLEVCDVLLGAARGRTGRRAPYRRSVTSTRTGRWIRLDGTTNTRDLGGLPTTDGGRTVPGRILRSDNLQTLSEDDVRRLVEEIGLREVIDLRTTAEILLEGRGPLRAVENVTHRHFSLLPERGHYTDVFAVEEDDPLPDLPEDWVDSVLPRQAPEHDKAEPPAVRSYLGYLSDRADAVVAALRALAAPGDRASVVHCAAGKDRTGVVVALALAVAGVGHDDIVTDYAMTADVIDALVAKLAASPTYSEDMDQRDVASHTPRAETMDRVLTLLDERYGGAVGWLSAHGFGPNEQAALRLRLRD